MGKKKIKYHLQIFTYCLKQFGKMKGTENSHGFPQDGSICSMFSSLQQVFGRAKEICV